MKSASKFLGLARMRGNRHRATRAVIARIIAVCRSGGAAYSAPTMTSSHQYGDWLYRCFAVTAPVKCDIYQLLMAPRTKRRLLSISIALVPSKGTYVAQIMTPLGVSFSSG